MRHPVPTPRAFAIALLALAVPAVSGCHWFHRGGDVFAQSEQSRPLEVPPDLNLPNTDAAMKLPPTASATAPGRATQGAAASASTVGFTVPGGDRDAVFKQVGDALDAMPDVTVASRAQLLGAYDVSYAGSDFLVRITKVEAGAYVSAVDPRGLPATGEGPAKLLAALKAAISP